MKHIYRLMHLPSIEKHTYVLVTSQGDSIAVRHYPDETAPPRIHRSHTVAEITADSKRSQAPVIEEEPKRTELSAHWRRRIDAANRAARLGGPAGSTPAPTASPELLGDPRAASNASRFVNHLGRPLVTVADWQAIHPEVHWKGGYSAMELARSWHAAEGFPPAVASALGAGPFAGLRLDRAIAECRTAVPGAGRPSHTDLMVEATDPAGNRVVVAVEGKVKESFGPLVGAWLQTVDHQRSASNKQERLQGLCDGLGLSVACTDSLRYQLLHRTWAGLRHAVALGATRTILLVHSFAPAPDADNRSAFAAFLVSMGHAGFTPGALVPLGRRMGIDLWAVWVSDTALPGQ